MENELRHELRKEKLGPKVGEFAYGSNMFVSSTPDKR